MEQKLFELYEKAEKFQNAGERNFHVFYQLCEVNLTFIINTSLILFDDSPFWADQYSYFYSVAQGADESIRTNYGIAEFDNYNYLAR